MTLPTPSRRCGPRHTESSIATSNPQVHAGSSQGCPATSCPSARERLVKEFYYLAKYQMTVPGSDGAAGAIIIPSGLPSHTLTRRDLNRRLGRRLLDPQMYLSD